jgi:hypothetical protein
LSGKVLTVVVHTKNWGEDRVFFYTDEKQLRSIPCRWTSLAAPDDFQTIAGRRVLFRPDDLWRLAELIEEIERRRRGEASGEAREV